MLQKQSWVHITDNTNIRWVRIFHLYKGFFRKVSKSGFFIKGSARVVEPPRIEYKGFKYKYSVKGDICRGLIVRDLCWYVSVGGNMHKLTSNELIIIKKKSEPKSKYLNGPIMKNIKRKKLTSLFSKILM